MYKFQTVDKSVYHFSFLRDMKVHGIYYNSFSGYFGLYPSLRKNHAYDFYSVLLITKGRSTILINNDVYAVQPQTICLIAPNQMHSFESTGDLEGIIISFCHDYYVEEFSFIRLLNTFSFTSQIDRNVCNPSIVLSDKEFSSVISTINSIQDEYESYTPDNNSAVIMRSHLNIMLLKLTELYEARSGKANKSDSILIHSLSHLIDTNFIKEQHIGFYASAFNISESQLNDICNKYFNCGLKKILQTRLMQEARKLLLSSELSVSEI
ncbi:MAG: hypothetical protein EPN88_12805, partial [Bacteroidetes bacterium]